MYGQLPRNLEEKLEDNKESYRWLKFGDIKGETESIIVAAQCQAISTNYFKYESLKEEMESKCRSYKQHEKTTGHLNSRCPILVMNEYLMKNDRFCKHLHYNMQSPRQ